MYGEPSLHPQLLRKTYYFSEYLNYYYSQTKETVNKIVTHL